MPAFFLSLLLAALLTLAGREAVGVARLAVAARGSGPIVAAGILAAVLSSAFAAWLGSMLAPSLPGQAKLVFVALALVLAAFEVALLRAKPAPREPTRSAGATFITLLAAQVTDGARFVVLALAVMTGEPVLAAAGGAMGSGAALAVAALAGAEWERRVPLAALRIGAASLLVLAAAIIVLVARGIIF